MERGSSRGTCSCRRCLIHPASVPNLKFVVVNTGFIGLLRPRPDPGPPSPGNRPATQGLILSHPRCIMCNSRIHHRFASDVKRTGAGIKMLRADPPGGWGSALGDRWRWWRGRARRSGPFGRFFGVLVIGNRVGGLLSPLPGICNDFLIQDTSWVFAADGSGLPLRWLAPLPGARSGGSDYPECPALGMWPSVSW